MVLVKRFEPIKPGDDPTDPTKVGKADGRSVDVQIVGDYAYFTYDSFGVVAYRIDDPDPAVYDLISTDELVANNITDPTKIWKPGGNGFDYRPVAVARFKLQDETLGRAGHDRPQRQRQAAVLCGLWRRGRREDQLDGPGGSGA